VSEARTGALTAAGAALLFGSSYMATAFALRAFGPLAIGAWRGVAAWAIVGGLMIGGRLDGRAALATLDRGGWLRLGLLGMLGGPVFLVAMNLAVGGSGATIAAFVVGLYAVLAALLGPPLLGERLGLGPVVAFVVALLGTAFLAGLDPGSERPFGLGSGIGAGLIGATSFALYLVLTRRWARTLRLPGAAVAMANFAASAVVLVPLTLLIPGQSLLASGTGPDTAVAIVALAWLIVGSSVAAQLLLVAGVRRLPARVSSAFLLLNPLAASGLAALLLGERLSPIQLAGAALVLTGIALATGVPELIGSARRRVTADR
jgi:drug/metabolite transporter (DMT)-like permease